MDENKEIKIIDLNNSCLIEIFKNLNYEDLLSLKKARNSFGAAVDFVVRTSDIQFTIKRSEINQDDQYVVQFRKIKRFLQEFGNKLKSLRIMIDYAVENRRSLISYIFQTLIENYCSNGNIEHCTLSNFDFSKEFLDENQIFLRSLVSLKLMHVDFNNDEMLCLMDFIIGSRIKELVIYSWIYPIEFNILKKIASSRLESVYICVDDGFKGENREDYENFDIPVNTALKSLKLPLFAFDSAYLKHFPNIEALKYDYHPRPLNHICDLVKLRELTLNYEYEDFGEISSILERLAERNSLKQLTLYDSSTGAHKFDRADETLLARILCKMTNLEDLKLETSFSFVHHLPQIAQKLRNLKRFCYEPTDMLEIGPEVNHMLATLLEFVRKAKNLVYLNINCCLKHNFQQFYEDLVTIRRLQEANYVLYVQTYNYQKIVQSAEQRKFVKINR